MRSNDIFVRLTMVFPVGRPDLNGVRYTEEAVENALNAMEAGVPIDLVIDGDEKIVGITSSKPYAIYYDEVVQGVRFTVDGTILHGGTCCIVDDIHDGVVNHFSITRIGISE